MTNHESWRFYTSELSSPFTYIDAAWSFLIGSALQRRVWIESAKTVWPNQYVFFVAPPGVGKSVTDEVYKFLTYYDKTGRPVDTDDLQDGKEFELLFPVSATSTTYAKFVETIASVPRFVDGTKPRYMHMSTTFVLDEMTSIFRRDAEQMMALLLSGWTCVGNLDHSTISRGCNRIRNICINMIGGTQPEKFTKMKVEDIIDSGMLRRALFIYETRQRKRHFLIPEHTPEQLVARQRILAHLLKLSKLFGPVRLTPAALEYMQDYWADEGRVRVNKSPFLNNYYTSKNLFVMKTAMALHFGESLDMTIDTPVIQKAIDWHTRFEEKMHLPFAPKAATDIADVKDIVVGMLENTGGRGLEIVPMYRQVSRKVSFDDFVRAVQDLQTAQAITKVGEVFQVAKRNGEH